MAKRKIKNTRGTTSTNHSFTIHNEIMALAVVAFGLLLGVSIFTEAAGLIGQSLKEFFMGLLSYYAFGIPILITVYGMHYMIRKGSFNNGYKYWLTFGLLILAAGITHIFYYKNGAGLSAKECVEFFFLMGKEGHGGGFVGWLLAQPLIALFGDWGAGIILTTLSIVFIVIITKISIFKIVEWIYQTLKQSIADMRDHAVEELQESRKRNVEKKEKAAVEKVDKLDSSQKTESEAELEVAVAEPSIKIFDYTAEVAELVIEPVEDQSGQLVIKDSIAAPPPKVEKKQSSSASEVEQKLVIPPDNEPIEYLYPPVELLSPSSQSGSQKNSVDDLKNNAKKLVDTLKSFGVDAKVLHVSKGPSVTRYELQPSAGVKVSKIVGLSDDIALNLAAAGIRMEAPIPGKAAVGIEVPNSDVSPVTLREVIETEDFSHHPSKLAFAIGKDISGKSVVADIARMPHLLIAGATGSGKSVCINTLITSILYKANPNEVKLVMIDPKVVELGIYNGIPHLLIPVVTEPKKASGALCWAVQEMVNRYKLFADNNVRDLKGYNQMIADKGEGNSLPQIVIIIDELADLMMVAPNEVEDSICRLAQMARAAGMHLVIATQRPSVDVITGIIKANIPSRISFAVSSQVDSRTILDMAGAEKLLGKGDMLFYPVGAAKPIRLQGAFISDKEVESVVEYVKGSSGANYHEDILEQIESEREVGESDPGDNDELLPQAIELVVDGGQASVSMLQRRLKVGYARAARLIDQMEARGIVGGFEGSKPRQVLITRQQYQEMMMNSDD